MLDPFLEMHTCTIRCLQELDFGNPLVNFLAVAPVIEHAKVQ